MAKPSMSKCTTARSSEKGREEPLCSTSRYGGRTASCPRGQTLIMSTKESDCHPLTTTQMPAKEGRGQ